MTLVEQAKDLEELAKRRRDRQVREGEAQKFRTRTQNLSGLVSRIRTARTKWDVLRRSNFTVGDALPGPLKKLDAYVAVPPDQAEPAFRQADWDSLARALKTFAEALETSVSQVIESAKMSLLDGASATEMKGYTYDPATKAKAESLLLSFGNLSDRNWKTVSEPELGVLLQHGCRFRDDFKALREQGASEALRKFLAIARSDAGAELDALTDEVRRELAERRLLSRMRLVIK